MQARVTSLKHNLLRDDVIIGEGLIVPMPMCVGSSTLTCLSRGLAREKRGFNRFESQSVERCESSNSTHNRGSARLGAGTYCPRQENVVPFESSQVSCKVRPCVCRSIIIKVNSCTTTRGVPGHLCVKKHISSA